MTLHTREGCPWSLLCPSTGTTLVSERVGLYTLQMTTALCRIGTLSFVFLCSAADDCHGVSRIASYGDG
jgi:hypothetical protein